MSSVRAWSHAQLSMCVGARIFVFFQFFNTVTHSRDNQFRNKRAWVGRGGSEPCSRASFLIKQNSIKQLFNIIHTPKTPESLQCRIQGPSEGASRASRAKGSLAIRSLGVGQLRQCSEQQEAERGACGALEVCAPGIPVLPQSGAAAA